MTKWIGYLMILPLLGLFPTASVANGGKIVGKVTLNGAAPQPTKTAVSTDATVCGDEQESEELVVGGDKAIRYAVVRLVTAPEGASVDATVPAELSQKGCRYTPHVVVVPMGGTLDVLNDDGITHNLHSASKANRPFNKSHPAIRKKLSQKFAKAEIVELTCDVHGWMKSWIVVTDHPFVAVTDETGSFKLENVPDGTYQLEVWHEKLGTQTQEVTVAGGEVGANFELALK